jgi:serine/threonine protein kinase
LCTVKLRGSQAFLKVLERNEHSVIQILQKIEAAAMLLCLPVYEEQCYQSWVAYFPFAGTDFRLLNKATVGDHRITILVQFVAALALLHQNGIAHGDISNRNIVFHSHTQSLKLLDFGESTNAPDVLPEAKKRDLEDAVQFMQHTVNSKRNLVIKDKKLYSECPPEVDVFRGIIDDLSAGQYEDMVGVWRQVKRQLDRKHWQAFDVL